MMKYKHKKQKNLIVISNLFHLYGIWLLVDAIT